jgi:hypothetical protein
MAVPTLTNPTGRNTRAHVFADAAGNEYFFSYETCIAYRGEDNEGNWVALRRENDWGPTTGRHFRELGCDNFAKFRANEFEQRMEAIARGLFIGYRERSEIA